MGSRWSTKLAWLCKRNAVPVLATLILLSYTKFLNTILKIFTYTTLEHESLGYIYDTQKLWLADGNVFYLGPDHRQT